MTILFSWKRHHMHKYVFKQKEIKSKNNEIIFLYAEIIHYKKYIIEWSRSYQKQLDTLDSLQL